MTAKQVSLNACGIAATTHDGTMGLARKDKLESCLFVKMALGSRLELGVGICYTAWLACELPELPPSSKKGEHIRRFVCQADAEPHGRAAFHRITGQTQPD